ncbi:MAG: hypothetical protein ACJA1I_002581 [Zhongshania marina]|jgi:hypothetical protein
MANSNGDVIPNNTFATHMAILIGAMLVLTLFIPNIN